MADEQNRTVGDEIANGAKKTAETAAKAANSAKNVTKAAAKAASGNYVGAAADVLKDENLRRGIAIVLILSFFLTTMIFFAAPLALFATIMDIAGRVEAWAKESGEAFDEAYYQGSSGRFLSFFKATGAMIGSWFKSKTDEVYSDTTYGTEEKATNDDLFVFHDRASLNATYERKLYACEEKINSRMETIRKTIASDVKQADGYVSELFQNRFNAEREEIYKSLGKSPDDPSVNVVYGGVRIELLSSTVSKEQAAQLLSLYSSQINSSLDHGDVVGLLKWLGYNAGGNKTVTFSLGENSEYQYTMPAWKGTFLPQYLIDEAVSRDNYDKNINDRDSLKEYQDKYGCAVVDYMLMIDCPNFNAVPAMSDQINKNGTVRKTTEITFDWPIYNDADADPTTPQVYYDASNKTLSYGRYDKRYYEEKWNDTLGMKFLSRKADAPKNENIYTYHYVINKTEDVQMDIDEITVSYTVPVQITVRPVNDIIALAGLWQGDLPAEAKHYFGVLPSEQSAEQTDKAA